jgi:hypothetical protein
MTALGQRVALGALLLTLAAMTAVACGGSHAVNDSPRVPGPVASARASALASARASEASRAPAISHRLATISRRAIGPFVARTGDAGLAAWIVAADRGGRQDLVAVALAGDGAPLAEPRVVASVPQEASSLVVRPAGGAHGGWLLAWSALLDRGESLTILGLAPDGAARGAPTDVQRTSDHLRWSDVVRTSRGAVCVWAEETSSGDANILASAIDWDGKPLGMPVRVARSVDRWQAVPLDDGVGLALVTAAHRGDDSGAPGRLSFMRLDAQGHPLADALAIGSKPTVSGDVDAVSLPAGVLLAWTDRTGEDAQIMLATVDASGHSKGPTPALDSVGGSSLVALASGSRGAALVWQEPSAGGRAAHNLHLAVVSPSAPLAAQSVTSIESASGGAPEFAATDSGFALLASAHACMASPSEGPCSGPVVPTYVRFGARLDPIQTEPILLGEGTAATALGWGLRCAADRCLALAATGETPTPIFAVDFEPRTSPFASPVASAPPAEAPRLKSIETIASGMPFDDIAAARLGDATVIATLASGPGGDSDRDHPRGGVLTLRTLDGEGRPRGAATTLSSRAVTVGGVALAPGGALEDGAAVAWVGGDDHGPQVHVTHLDRGGHRNNEVQLTTRAKGDASSVAIAWAENGWIVAWVDSRDGNGEVYATKIDRDLNRVAREERITNAAGDAGDVALAVRGNIAWLAWSDPRESPREGLADIYATTLRTLDAKRAGDEVRVLATASHSRSPQLAPSADGKEVVLAWIEDVPMGLEGPGAAMVTALDRDAHVVRPPAKIALSSEGRPTSIALAPVRDTVRAVIVRSGPESVTLDALVLGADGTSTTKAWPLLDLDAPASFDVAVALAGDALVFDDVGAVPGDHHVRRAAIVWRR